MKRIFITESQKKLIEETVLNKAQSDICFSDDESSLINIISKKIENKLLEKRKNEVFEVVCKLFGEQIKNEENLNNVISKTLSEIVKKEDIVKEFLEKLCFDSTIELFNCPDGLVNLTCSLVKNVDSSNTTIHINSIENDFEFNDSFEYEHTEIEIEKRLLLNTIITGASIVLTKKIIKDKKEEIKKYDSSLYDLYRKLLWLNEYNMFVSSIEVSDETPNQSGGVDVKLGTKKKQTIIESKALCFPILLYESIKGFFELFISHGLPSDRKSAEYILDQADSLKYDKYSIAVGPIIWNKIMSIMCDNGVDTAILPQFMNNLSTIELSEFNNIIKEVVLSTKRGKNIIENMLMDIVDSNDYEEFENRLNTKRQEKNMLNDSEYMSSEELLDEEEMMNETSDSTKIFNANKCINYDTIFIKKKVDPNFSVEWLLENSIKEELAINSIVENTSLDIISNIKKLFSEKAIEKSEIVCDGVKKNNVNFIYNLNDIKIRFHVYIYNFYNKKIYDDKKNDIDLNSTTYFYNEKNVVVNIEGYSISGTINESDLSDTIQHEINHVFQKVQGKRSNIKKDILYSKVKNVFRVKTDKEINTIANSLYYSFDDEQDSFVNGLYAYLMSSGLMVSWDKIKKNTIVYKGMESMRESLKLLENIDEEKLKYYFGINKKECIKIIQKGIQRFQTKIGKVMIKHRKEMLIKECVIDKNILFFPYIHNIEIDD